MKIKLKRGIVLPNNWKASGHSRDDWQTLNGGGVLEVTGWAEEVDSSSLKNIKMTRKWQ